MPLTNHRFLLAARPVGLPTREIWTFDEEVLRDPGPGEFLVQVLFISLDPAMRGWLNESRSYVAPVALGEVMRALAVGRVIASENPSFPVGTHVSGLFGVQEYAVSGGSGVTVIDPTVAPLPVHLSTLGMTGMTAYFGLLDLGRPQPGQTVVVSAAAGAVGGVVGQLAKIHGCRAVGIAGGAEKCRYLTEDLGFDAAIDYKAGSVGKALHEHCPDGIDVYFDNVGGDILDAALAGLARGARVVICGAISQYNNTTPPKGPANYMSLLVNRASMAGFLVFDYADQFATAGKEMAGWLASGQLRSREDIVAGLSTFPETLLKLFTGDNIGKLVLQVADS
ncbi:MAG: NADP-dependent oxidoreductase [Mycobacteriales bacterium]